MPIRSTSFEGNLILPAIIQFGGARRLVIGDLLGDFKLAAVGVGAIATAR
jgi:hypothetical protein